MRPLITLPALALVALVVRPARAQQAPALAPAIDMQHFRPVDARGIGMFETPKQDTVTFTGFKANFGAAFAQEFQALQHSNTAAPNIVSGVDQNALIGIGNGFNTAAANLYLNAQLADGIRVQMEAYLSSRHHNEAWVKDGYLLIDKLPFDNPLLNRIMQYTTVKAGHFEINYGDEHFRRTDNGLAMDNPFVGNLIMDAFTTEIGGEIYVRNRGWMAMGGMTGGGIHGQVTAPGRRAPSYLGKVGYDSQLKPKVRVRLTGSFYANAGTTSNTLYWGNRAGSPYFDVMENTASTETDNAWSGELNPLFSHNVHAYVANPFVRLGGFEYLGNFEAATGRSAAEVRNRTMHQLASELLYRFADDKMYVGGRYNTVVGELPGIANDITVRRTAAAVGWFLTPALLTKLEWVNQKYLDFPVSDIRNGGEFKGFMLVGAVGF